MTAYDYDKQCWLNGQAAIELRRRQLAEDIEFFNSPRGAEHAQFLGRDHADLLRAAKDEFARL